MSVTAGAQVATALDEAAIGRWRDRIRQTTFANYHFEMGIALLMGGDAQAAHGALQRAVEIQPDLAILYPLLVLAEERLGQAEAARQRQADLQARAPALWLDGCANLSARLLKDGKADGVLWARRFVDLAPATDIRVPALAGLAAHVEGRVADALAAWAHTLTLANDIPASSADEVAVALADISNVLFAQWQDDQVRRTELALAAAQVASRLVPTRPDLRFQIIRCLVRLVRPQEAVPEIEGYVALVGPGSADDKNLLLQWGMRDLAAGDLAAAEEHFSRCAQIDTGWAQPESHRAVVALRRGDAAQAAVHAQAGCAREPRNYFANQCRGLVEFETGALAPAVASLKQASAQAPNQPLAKLLLAMALDAAGQGGEAVAAYREADAEGGALMHRQLALYPAAYRDRLAKLAQKAG
jgi:tetratricopeptide (TPR) repeat protein